MNTNHQPAKAKYERELDKAIAWLKKNPSRFRTKRLRKKYLSGAWKGTFLVTLDEIFRWLYAGVDFTFLASGKNHFFKMLPKEEIITG